MERERERERERESGESGEVAKRERREQWVWKWSGMKLQVWHEMQSQWFDKKESHDHRSSQRGKNNQKANEKARTGTQRRGKNKKWKNGGSRTRTKKANVRQEFGMKKFFSLQLKTFQFSHSKLNQHNDDCNLSLPWEIISHLCNKVAKEMISSF